LSIENFWRKEKTGLIGRGERRGGRGGTTTFIRKNDPSNRKGLEFNNNFEQITQHGQGPLLRPAKTGTANFKKGKGTKSKGGCSGEKTPLTMDYPARK